MAIDFNREHYECKKCKDKVTPAEMQVTWDDAKKHMSLVDGAFDFMMPLCGQCMDDFLIQCVAHNKFAKDPTRDHESWDKDCNVISANDDPVANINPRQEPEWVKLHKDKVSGQ